MSDPSPDTPNVCPTCGSSGRPERRRSASGGRTHCGHEWHAHPAAGSSSPDVTALIAAAAWVQDAAFPDMAMRAPSLIGQMADALEAQATRITGLERWKAEALVVLSQWDEVWEALGRPGPLGSSKAVEALTEAHRLRATDPPADVHPRHPRQETP